eukprot:Gregarina_sp_Poly_1__2012@NODE_1529_length_3921_cov_123_027244_g248_i3_p2_GENE_NODE_1529_length_3921_cov_123_027244_g248_i3NODE_1529_length_3921_cov_123_027244_g248_i3_p2_ORF_typecomplete_len240_score25_52_NODE_1529_length_3921_cov_123_027244_g248_i3115834
MAPLNILLLVLCGLCQLATGRRLTALPLAARLAEVHDFDCATANTDLCQQRCEQSEYCQMDMTDRAQYRRCFFDLGSECGIMGNLYRRTNRTVSHLVLNPTQNRLTIRSAVADVFELGQVQVSASYYYHKQRLWLPNAVACDGISVPARRTSISAAVPSASTPVTMHLVEDGVLEFDTTSLFAAGFYGVTIDTATLGDCMNLTAMADDKSLRVEQWYVQFLPTRIWGTDTLSHLALYEP